jgi:hypothetical protein
MIIKEDRLDAEGGDVPEEDQSGVTRQDYFDARR